MLKLQVKLKAKCLECERTSVVRGYCKSHYERVRLSGKLTSYVAKGSVSTNGYRVFRGAKQEIKYEHRMVAEKALGKPLPPGAVIHHINGDRSDNRPENLVVCPNFTYHMLIHKLMRKKDIRW